MSDAAIKEYDAEGVAKSTMERLSGFQKATVRRVIKAFRKNQNRILVADEVGLGKTVVARGVIVEFAKLRKEEGDKLVKIAYICSNQGIAAQNVQKLAVSESAIQDEKRYIHESRLSMQHLRVAEQEYPESGESVSEFRVQLISLTPETSFRVNRGLGTRAERALMYVMLERHFGNLPALLERKMFQAQGRNCADEDCAARQSWGSLLKDYRQRVFRCFRNSNETYPAKLWEQIDVPSVRECLAVLEAGNSAEWKNAIRRLRQIFAKASAAMLEPDLVIMDEFQRFRFLLDEKDSETGDLVGRFLDKNGNDNIRLLLLSATPYKLYSTWDEDERNGGDESYKEFKQLVEFLAAGDMSKDGAANAVKGNSALWQYWDDYRKKFSAGCIENNPALESKKSNAENSLSEVMCRTERISFMDGGDYIEDVDCDLEVTESDVAGYVEFSRFLTRIEPGMRPPVEYAKSCPYLLSYLDGYALKKEIEKKLRECPDKGKPIGKGCAHLWVNRDIVKKYGELKHYNARLRKLIEIAFDQNRRAARYMWLPPLLPYYEMEGAYKGAVPFSKVLVFSAWAMVPRMIATLVSYEAERLVLGGNEKKPSYTKKFEPKFDTDSMGLKSVTGQGIANAALKDKPSHGDAVYQRCAEWHVRNDWSEDNFAEFAENLLWLAGLWDPMETMGKALQAVTDAVKGKLPENGFARPGMPPDVGREAIVDMAIGNPIVCIARSMGISDSNKVRIAKAALEVAALFWERFNRRVPVAIVEKQYKDDVINQTYGGRDYTKAELYWWKVVRYCKDGCFQAMFDEYYAILKDENSFEADENAQREKIVERMKEALLFREQGYQVDTIDRMKKRIEKRIADGSDAGKSSNGDPRSMRVHYAVGLLDGKGDAGQDAQRKDSIRLSFNSPLRPFVLASTSIGQEGLDFHPYCRRIFHWNLPPNPVDMEQREGRINRRKCLAVRENVAKLFKEQHANGQITGNIWEVAWKEAEDYIKQNAEDGNKLKWSGMSPAWCFGKGQSVKVERIVPLYPFSRDKAAYERLKKILSLYRLSMGQPRQEELMESILEAVGEDGLKRRDLEKYFINLCPFLRENKTEEQK